MEVMMKTLFDKDKLKKTCFPDVDVIEMSCDFNNKILIIKLTGCFLLDSRTQFDKGELIFKNWQIINVDKYDPKSESWTPLENPNDGVLENILEFEVSDDLFDLQGMAKNIPEYIRWKVKNSTVSGEFEEFIQDW